MGRKIRIGPAGNTVSFFESKYRRDNVFAPIYYREIGLSAYEIQQTYGVRTPKEKAIRMKESAKKADIELSIHAPYYVVLTSDKKDVVKRSKERLMKALRLADIEGARRIVFHPGFYGKNPSKAMKTCLDGLKEVHEKAKQEKLTHIQICTEVTGKKSALGSLEDVIKLSQEIEQVFPCVDFAHLHARTRGTLHSKDQILKVFETIEKEIDKKTAKELHCHMYSIIFGPKGERHHVPYNQKGKGPSFKNFCDAVIEFGATPTIICESTNSQDEGALYMKKYFEKKGLKSKIA